VEVARHQPVGRARGASLGQEQHVVAGDRLVQRRAEFFPVREQLVDRDRVHHGAGQDVGADLGSLLEHADAHLSPALRCELLDTDRRREPGGPTADDDDVVFHRFALDRFRKVCHEAPGKCSATGDCRGVRLEAAIDCEIIASSERGNR
jgi:hypothetical protein